MTCVHSYIPKSEGFSLIPEDHCSLLFAPGHFPFSCLTGVTLQDSTKLWAIVEGECDSGSQYFWDIDDKSNIPPFPPKSFFPMYVELISVI